jgi:acyl-CoA synthetase (AMP-forming)/AMP-acid ligase II
MLESFYAVPQLGAVIVPLNYRLTPDDFQYLIEHSGARVSARIPTTSTRSTAFATVCPRSSTSSRSRVSGAAGSTTKQRSLRRR